MQIECDRHRPEEVPSDLWTLVNHALREALEGAGLGGPMVHLRAATACRACHRLAANFEGEGWVEVSAVVLPDDNPALWRELGES